MERIYKDKLIRTTLTEKSLRKLIIDTYTKTAFMANNGFYDQIDRVSIGSSLGPVLSNISDVARIHQFLLKQFDPNLKFTVDTFENETPHISSTWNCI